jgi:sugar lactone lactonase YvrE
MIATLAPAGAQDSPNPIAAENPVLVDGGPIAGSANGMFFDADNNLWVVSVFGRQINKINPDTGEILETLGEADGVFAPDDITIGADGTLYWTEIFTSAVASRAPGGETVFLVPPGGLQNANPITLSDDGRLFAAGCYTESAGIFEIDPVNGGIIDTVRDGDPGCASNAMDFLGDTLYSPRPFEDRIVAVDIDTGELTNVTTGWAAPIAVKFNSDGELHAGAQGTGEVIKVDLTNPDTTANREVIATFPVGWIDNLAFDKDDRLYVSSASDGGIVEILDDGSTREVVPGVFTVPLGLGMLGEELITANNAQLLSFDKRTGDLNSVFRSVAGIGPLPFMTSMAVADEYVVGMDFFFGNLALVDPATGTTVASAPMPGPADAHGYRGDLIVTDFATGQVVRVATDDLTDRDVIATLAVPVGLAGDDDNVFVSALATGEIVQVIDGGQVLATPRVIATGLAGPEGLTLHNNGTSLLVVEGALGSVAQVDIATGDKETIIAGLDFFGGVPGLLPFGFFNDVESDGEAIFVAADRGNKIHRFETCGGMTSAQAQANGYAVDDRSGESSGQSIAGSAGPDWIIGSDSRDIISGRASGDVICSRGGKDIVNGNWGPDVIFGGQQGDSIRGGPGNDVIYGEGGWDWLFGGRGADSLDGGAGRDRLQGGPGRDSLTGGPNVDRMWGGVGIDVCTDITNADTARSCRAG